MLACFFASKTSTDQDPTHQNPMSYDIMLSQFGLCKRLLLIRIKCYMTSCSSVFSDITVPADLDPVLYEILLIRFSGIMSPTDHDLVLYNIMLIWFSWCINICSTGCSVI